MKEGSFCPTNGPGGAARIDPAADFAPDQRTALDQLSHEYNLDSRLLGRLSLVMVRRKATFMEDVQMLFLALKTARNPPGLLSVKIAELEADAPPLPTPPQTAEWAPAKGLATKAKGG